RQRMASRIASRARRKLVVTVSALSRASHAKLAQSTRAGAHGGGDLAHLDGIQARTPHPPRRPAARWYRQRAVYALLGGLRRRRDQCDPRRREPRFVPAVARHPFRRGRGGHTPAASSSRLVSVVNSACGALPPITNISIECLFLGPLLIFMNRRETPGGNEITSSGPRSTCSILPLSLSQLQRHVPVDRKSV